MTLEQQFAAGNLDAGAVLRDLAAERGDSQLLQWLAVFGAFEDFVHHDGCTQIRMHDSSCEDSYPHAGNGVSRGALTPHSEDQPPDAIPDRSASGWGMPYVHMAGGQLRHDGLMIFPGPSLRNLYLNVDSFEPLAGPPAGDVGFVDLA